MVSCDEPRREPIAQFAMDGEEMGCEAMTIRGTGIWRYVKLLGVPLMVLLLAAGACEERGTKDAPIDPALQDNAAPFIVNMPDSYMNLALKCLGDDLIIAHTREAAPVVIGDSAACDEGGVVPHVALRQ